MSIIHKQMSIIKIHTEVLYLLDEIKVGLLGLGTVGGGVVRIIENHQDKLIHQIGCPVIVKKALVKDRFKERAVQVTDDRLTDKVEDILFDPEIDIIIEVMGGIEETKQHIIQALKQKKHVITANKDLMAVYGPELLKVAKENECDLFYEASVAGGIPILRSLVEGLASDRITKMMGIVNGTTNFILTKMAKESGDYDEVLKEAQQLGFAESDPTADVSGLDAARKMAILATLGFSMTIDLQDVRIKGIESITSEDIEYGKKFGYTMKLIGFANRRGNKVEVSVEPTFLPNEHPLSSVLNEYNAVYVYGEAVGETMFYGPGAGQLPTATAVVSDLVAVIKNLRLGVNGKGTVLAQFPKELLEKHEISSKYFLRLLVKDQPGAFADITTLFAKAGISFEKILQLPTNEKAVAEIVLVTHHASLEEYENVYHDLEGLEVVRRIVSSYRVEGGR